MKREDKTLEDVVAQIRAAAYIQNADTPQSVLRLADRIEAAWKREKAEVEALALSVGGMVEASRYKQVGNAAAMREALEWCRDFMRDIYDGKKGVRFSADDIERIETALAAPPRNCDVYDSESCRMAYHLHGDGILTMQAFAKWLFATATAKESEVE